MEGAAPKSVTIRRKRRSHLPKSPFETIALSFSGGGFRATSMHLGLLSYLHHIPYQTSNLLEHVRVLSTVSGGTFTGIKYITGLKRGHSFDTFYHELYDFMTKFDLVEEALKYLAEDENWKNGRQRSLINAFASVYYQAFEDGHFDMLWQDTKPIHLKEICFNATEFHFALPFHFQKTEHHSPDEKIGLEHVGNRKIRIPSEMAKEIRLADIIAASSCVPFGFEPINFPDDFTHSESQMLRMKHLLPKHTEEGTRISYPIGLMDGGIDDNQGVEAVLAAEERMRNYPPKLHAYRSNDKKAIDLYILSDGTNPTMDHYVQSSKDKIPFFGAWSFKVLQSLGISSFIGGTTLLTIAGMQTEAWIIMLLSVCGTIGILVAGLFLAVSRGFTGLTRRLGVPGFFLKRMRHVDKLKFATLNTLLANRRNSASQMITKVFIKQMRWFSFERVFGDKDWKPRVVLNAVVELTHEEVEKRKRKYPFYSKELLEPGEAMIQVAEKALKMGTTLWFTEGQLAGKHNMPDSIIACGQFSMCFNLLEYFEKYLWHPRYMKDYEKYSIQQKAAFAELHERLLIDWRKFKKNPYWMVEERKRG